MTSTRTQRALKALEDVVSAKEGGERRQQQVDMIEAICQSIESGTRLMVEAGTGSGKSFAELIPGSIYADKESRWVFSTATNQLTDQIGRSDLPFLETVIPSLRGRWATLKGRANYVCLDRVSAERRLDEQAKIEAGQTLLDIAEDDLPEEAKEKRAILAWVETTEDGDRSSAPLVSDKTWGQLSRTSSTCPGAKVCPFASECFAEKAAERAKAADIVVTNHAVSAIHLKSLSTGVGEPILGSNVSTMVFDEAHELESYLSSSWGVTLSQAEASRLTGAVKGFLGESNKDLRSKIEKTFDRLFRSAVSECKKAGSSIPVPSDGDYPGAIDKHLGDLLSHVSSIRRITLNDTKNKELQYRWIDEMQGLINLLRERGDHNVRWISYDDGSWKKDPKPSAELGCAPRMIGPLLREYTEDNGINTIFTSATIRVQGDFTVPNQKLGGGEVNSITLGSPFNYARQGILCIPDVPEPSGSYDERKEHFKTFKEMALDMSQTLGGATLILCTSKRNTLQMSEYLEENGVDVVNTVDMPQAQASQTFKENRGTVMVGTYGVWQGLDVPGDSLQCVMIEKIPFNRVDDMLANARKAYWDENGENGFLLEPIAAAQTRLNQAVGRLIRTQGDRGIVIIADPRMKTKPYGRGLTRGLPGFYRQDNFESVIESARRLRDRVEQG